jgi:hypothetical protein
VEGERSAAAVVVVVAVGHLHSRPVKILLPDF